MQVVGTRLVNCCVLFMGDFYFDCLTGQRDVCSLEVFNVHYSTSITWDRVNVHYKEVVHYSGVSIKKGSTVPACENLECSNRVISKAKLLQYFYTVDKYITMAISTIHGISLRFYYEYHFVCCVALFYNCKGWMLY